MERKNRAEERDAHHRHGLQQRFSVHKRWARISANKHRNAVKNQFNNHGMFIARCHNIGATKSEKKRRSLTYTTSSMRVNYNQIFWINGERSQLSKWIGRVKHDAVVA